MINKNFLIGTCLISASTAGVKVRAGMLSYAVSKAALATLSRVYALENPDIFFAVIGLCNVDTKLSRDAISGENVKLFPELMQLKESFGIPGYICSPDNRAEQIWKLISGDYLKSNMISGCFYDIREVVKDFCKL